MRKNNKRKFLRSMFDDLVKSLVSVTVLFVVREGVRPVYQGGLGSVPRDLSRFRVGELTVPVGQRY